MRATTQECCEQFWTSPGGNTPQSPQLYGHLPPITKTIKVRWTRHAGHCWRSRDELISDVLLWTPSYGRTKAGWPARTYIQQLCEDTGCNPEDLPEVMNDREEWRERVRGIRASSTTWWWSSLLVFIATCSGPYFLLYHTWVILAFLLYHTRTTILYVTMLWSLFLTATCSGYYYHTMFRSPFLITPCSGHYFF